MSVSVLVMVVVVVALSYVVCCGVVVGNEYSSVVVCWCRLLWLLALLVLLVLLMLVMLAACITVAACINRVFADNLVGLGFL